MVDESPTPAGALLANLDKLHTTELGKERIQNNLSLKVSDVTRWCRQKIQSPQAQIIRRGKNFYIDTGDCRLTVNAHSYTIITAHKIKKDSL